MGNLRHHMEALAHDVLASTRVRKAAVGEITAQTGRLLAAFGRERTRSAEALVADVANHRHARAAGSRARSHDVMRLLQGFRRDHHRMAEDQRDTLAEDFRRRSEAVAGLIEDFRLSRGETAQELADRLEAFVNGVQSHVSGLLADARAFRAETGRAVAQDLARTLTEIRNRTGEIAAETRNLRVRFRHTQEDRAGEIRNRLADSARARHDQVCRLMEDVRSWQQGLRMDLAAAHRVWNRLPEAQAGVVPFSRQDEEGTKRTAAEARKARERAEAEAARKRKADEEKRAKEAWAKMSDEKKVLHVIRQHSGGLTASQIGEIVDLHPSVVGRIATELVEQGAVGKNESTRLYFPLERE